MFCLHKHTLVAKNSSFKIFSKSKFARKTKVGTAMDSVFCQVYGWKIISDFLLHFDINFFFFHNNNNFLKITTYPIRKGLKNY